MRVPINAIRAILSLVILVVGISLPVAATEAIMETLEANTACYKVSKFYYAPDLEADGFPLHPWSDIQVLGKEKEFIKIKVTTKRWIVLPPGTEVEGYLWIK